MNLAGLSQDFDQPDKAIGPVTTHIRAYILDRNPVLSQCVSNSLSTFRPLECQAVAFDPVEPPAIDDGETGRVLVFDPAQISCDLDVYLSMIPTTHNVKTVAYSFDTSDVAVNQALDAGIDCYASKEQDLSVLYLAIATAAHGGRFLCPTVAQGFQRVRSAPSRDLETDPKSQLSARELSVLTALASGLSQKQTAFELQLSDKTVSTYKTRAMRKLGLTDRASIVQFAMSQNLIATTAAAY